MMDKITTLKKPILQLPETWRGGRVFVQFPDKDTIIVQKEPSIRKATEPEYKTDERNWKKIESTLRKTRKQIFKEFYPFIYGREN